MWGVRAGNYLRSRDQATYTRKKREMDSFAECVQTNLLMRRPGTQIRIRTTIETQKSGYRLGYSKSEAKPSP